MQATRRIRRIRGLQRERERECARGPGGRKEGERQMFRGGREGGSWLLACLLAGVAMLNNRVAGTFSRNEDVYQDPATGNWFTNRPREAAPLYPRAAEARSFVHPLAPFALAETNQPEFSRCRLDGGRSQVSLRDDRPLSLPSPSSYDETFVPWICKRLRNTYSDAADGGVARMVSVRVNSLGSC